MESKTEEATFTAASPLPCDQQMRLKRLADQLLRNIGLLSGQRDWKRQRTGSLARGNRVEEEPLAYIQRLDHLVKENAEDFLSEELINNYTAFKALREEVEETQTLLAESTYDAEENKVQMEEKISALHAKAKKLQEIAFGRRDAAASIDVIRSSLDVSRQELASLLEGDPWVLEKNIKTMQFLKLANGRRLPDLMLANEPITVDEKFPGDTAAQTNQRDHYTLSQNGVPIGTLSKRILSTYKGISNVNDYTLLQRIVIGTLVSASATVTAEEAATKLVAVESVDERHRQTDAAHWYKRSIAQINRIIARNIPIFFPRDSVFFSPAFLHAFRTIIDVKIEEEQVNWRLSISVFFYVIATTLFLLLAVPLGFNTPILVFVNLTLFQKMTIWAGIAGVAIAANNIGNTGRAGLLFLLGALTIAGLAFGFISGGAVLVKLGLVYKIVIIAVPGVIGFGLVIRAVYINYSAKKKEEAQRTREEAEKTRLAVEKIQQNQANAYLHSPFSPLLTKVTTSSDSHSSPFPDSVSADTNSPSTPTLTAPPPNGYGGIWETLRNQDTTIERETPHNSSSNFALPPPLQRPGDRSEWETLLSHRAPEEGNGPDFASFRRRPRSQRLNRLSEDKTDTDIFTDQPATNGVSVNEAPDSLVATEQGQAVQASDRVPSPMQLF